MSRNAFIPIVLLVLLAGIGFSPLGAAAWSAAGISPEVRPQATFTVNSNSDTQDANVGDGTWSTAGIYVITVTASNCSGAGMVQDTHTITISAGIVHRVFLPIVGKGP